MLKFNTYQTGGLSFAFRPIPGFTFKTNCTTPGYTHSSVLKVEDDVITYYDYFTGNDCITANNLSYNIIGVLRFGHKFNNYKWVKIFV